MMTDEHDAKCWRLLKQAIVISAPSLSKAAQEISQGMQGLMASAEVCVDQSESP